MFEHWLRCHALFEADREHLERVHVLTYEQLVRDPAGVLRGIFEFLELDPIAPSEPVEGGANEKYFRQWQELKRDLRMRAYLDLVSLRYERRVRRYGYSLLSPERALHDVDDRKARVCVEARRGEERGADVTGERASSARRPCAAAIRSAWRERMDAKRRARSSQRSSPVRANALRSAKPLPEVPWQRPWPFSSRCAPARQTSSAPAST